jgi:hypothetical protein
MAEGDEPHEIETIIANRNLAEAAKASADAEAKRKIQELADKVKQALVGAQETLREEIKKANAAIKRGGRTEEFQYQTSAQPASGILMTANLKLADGVGVLRDCVITVDSTEGKIVVRSHGVTLHQSLTNILQVKREDWSKFLSGMYASNMR